MNLFSEYRKRNNIPAISLVEEGVCFFNKDGKQHLIASISSHSKSAVACDACVDRATLIVELYDVKGFISPQSGFKFGPIHHTHLLPDYDLSKHLYECGYLDCVPHLSSGKRDQESWLWQFFLLTKPLHQRIYRDMMRDCKEHDPHNRTTEQMMWVSKYQGSAFSFYYNRLYSRCLLGKKYILIT